MVEQFKSLLLPIGVDFVIGPKISADHCIYFGFPLDTILDLNITSSNVRRSSQIPVWRLIRFDRPILPVSYNSINKLIGQVTVPYNPTDFQISQVTRSARSYQFRIGFKYCQARLD